MMKWVKILGKNAILKAWGKPGVTDGIKMESSKFPFLDPFNELDSLRED